MTLSLNGYVYVSTPFFLALMFMATVGVVIAFFVGRYAR